MDKLDLLGGSVNFYHNGKDSIKTGFGGFLTLFLAILLGLSIFAFGTDFFKRTNPQVSITTESPVTYPLNIINNKKNFTFAFRIEDPNGNPFRDDTSIYLTVWYAFYNKGDKGEWILKPLKLPITTCTPDMITQKEFSVEIDKLLCTNFDNFLFGGFWDDNFIARFILHADICEEGKINPNTNQKCKSDKEKESSVPINTLYLSMFYQHTIIDVNNYDNGIKTVIKNDYFRFDKYLYKIKYLFFKETTLLSDFGWLIESKRSEKVLGFSSAYMDIVTSTLMEGKTLTGRIGSAIVYGTREKDTIIRRYDKLQKLAAEVGGILKLVVTLFSFLAHQYAIFSTQLKFSNILNIYSIYNKNKEFHGIKNDSGNLSANPLLFNFNKDNNNIINNNNIASAQYPNSLCHRLDNNEIKIEEGKDKCSINQHINFLNLKENKEVKIKDENSKGKIENSNVIIHRIKNDENNEQGKPNVIRNIKEINLSNLCFKDIDFKETFAMLFSIKICSSCHKDSYFRYKELNNNFIECFQIENIIVEHHNNKLFRDSLLKSLK